MVGAWSTCWSIITAHGKVWLNDNDDNDDRSSGAIVKEHAAGWVDGWVHTYHHQRSDQRGTTWENQDSRRKPNSLNGGRIVMSPTRQIHTHFRDD